VNNLPKVAMQTCPGEDRTHDCKSNTLPLSIVPPNRLQFNKYIFALLLYGVGVKVSANLTDWGFLYIDLALLTPLSITCELFVHRDFDQRLLTITCHITVIPT